MSRKTLILFLLIGAGAAWWFFGKKKQLPAEAAVRQEIEAVARAAERGKVKPIVSVISDRFQGQGMDKQTLKGLIFMRMQRTNWSRVFIMRQDIKKLSETRVTASLDVLLAGGGKVESLADVVPEQAGAYHFDLTFELDDDEWRVVTASFRRLTVGSLLP